MPQSGSFLHPRWPCPAHLVETTTHSKPRSVAWTYMPKGLSSCGRDRPRRFKLSNPSCGEAGSSGFGIEECVSVTGSIAGLSWW